MKRSSVDDDIEMSHGPGRMKRMPFLSTGRSLGTRFYNYSRHFRHIALFMLVGAALVWIVDTWVCIHSSTHLICTAHRLPRAMQWSRGHMRIWTML